MDRQQILDLYQWHQGTCFRHPAKGDVPTAQITTLHPRAGDDEPIRACEDCVIELEQERWVEASRNGVEYRPGHAGETLL
jgi:hypothetical protein